MTLTGITLLLQAAVSLLALVQANPSLPQSTRDNAIVVAQNAIAQATTQLAANARKTTSTSNITPVTSSVKSSVLTSDQIRVNSPADTTISVGGKVTITYTVGGNIVVGDPAIIERSIMKAGTETLNSGYIPLSQVAGTYSFDWTPNEPGTYEAKITINHNNSSYSARSGVITAVGSPISASDLLTPTLSVSVSPTSISSGQSALLKWSSTNANRCGLQYWSSEEDIAISGTKTVSPSEKTTYFVWCTNDPGNGKDGPSARKNVTLDVTPVILPTPTIYFFSASPTSVKSGEYTTLSWSSSADNCNLFLNGSGGLTVIDTNIGSATTKTVIPDEKTTYTLRCFNSDPGGKEATVDATLTVTVQ